MKRLPFFLGVGMAMLGPVLAGPLPTATPSPAWTPQSFTPRDLPKAVEGTPQNPTPKKASPWISASGLGIGLPMANLGKAYGTAFQAELGSGLKLSDSFSIWLDVSLGLYGSKDNNLTAGNNYTLIEAAFWARYRLIPGDFSPFLFAGPGLAYNENRSNGAAQYDPYTGYGYVPVNAYEVDFLAEGGLGADYKLGGGVAIFLQGKLVYDFASPHFASFAATDSPIVVVPVEAGMLFGL